MNRYKEYHKHWQEVQDLLHDSSVDNRVIGEALKSLTQELGTLEVEYEVSLYDRIETV